MSKNQKFGIALIQLAGTADKVKNVENAITQIRAAVKTHKPKIVALPESFNSPYGIDEFDKHAEYIPAGYTSQALSSIAKELKIYLVGGTIPERDENDKTVLYNTATVWGPNGELITKHRKVHLFDYDLPNGGFNESATLTPGKQITIFEIEGIKFGLFICFDCYFHEFVKLYRDHGVDFMFVPSAFDLTIGPLHWDLLNRSRAADHQVFYATISPARDDTSAGYIAWGNTMLIDPLGQVVKKAGSGAETIFSVVDFSEVQKVRQQIPTSINRRPDVYDSYRK